MDARFRQRRSRPPALEIRAKPQREGRVIASSAEFAEALGMSPHPFIHAVYAAICAASNGSPPIPLKDIHTSGRQNAKRDYSPRSMFKKRIQSQLDQGVDLPIVLTGSSVSVSEGWTIENAHAPSFPFLGSQLRDQRKVLARIFERPLWFDGPAKEFIRALPAPSQVKSWDDAFILAQRSSPLIADEQDQLMLVNWEGTLQRHLVAGWEAASRAKRSIKKRRHVNWIPCAQTLLYWVLAGRAVTDSNGRELSFLTALRDAVIGSWDIT